MNLSRANRRILIIIVIGAGLVVGGTIGRLGPLRWVYDHTLVPVSRGIAAAGSSTSQTLTNIARVRHLAADNAQLEEENASLRQRLAADAETRRDNDLLREQLGLDVAGAPPEVAAEVVAFQPDSYRQFITINKGGQQGVKVGQGVLSEGVLIGVVDQVSARTAKIKLVTDPEFKITAKDQDSDGANGVVSGQLGSGLVMEKIDQTSRVKPGDTITTAGLEGSLPAGLLIGQIQSVNARDNAIFQSAEIATSLRANELRFVFVVTSS